MSTRNRSARKRNIISASFSEPGSLKTNKLPLLLPHIKSKKPHFYQQLLVSPDYIHISKTQRGDSSHRLQSHSPLQSSRARSIITSRPVRPLYQKYLEEDRVVQRYEQQQQKYKQLIQSLQRRSVQKQKKVRKGALSLIHDRLMRMLE